MKAKSMKSMILKADVIIQIRRDSVGGAHLASKASRTLAEICGLGDEAADELVADVIESKDDSETDRGYLLTGSGAKVMIYAVP